MVVGLTQQYKAYDCNAFHELPGSFKDTLLKVFPTTSVPEFN